MPGGNRTRSCGGARLHHVRAGGVSRQSRHRDGARLQAGQRASLAGARHCSWSCSWRRQTHVAAPPRFERAAAFSLASRAHAIPSEWGGWPRGARRRLSSSRCAASSRAPEAARRGRSEVVPYPLPPGAPDRGPPTFSFRCPLWATPLLSYAPLLSSTSSTAALSRSGRRPWASAAHLSPRAKKRDRVAPSLLTPARRAAVVVQQPAEKNEEKKSTPSLTK